jgi:hypothetical protein
MPVRYPDASDVLRHHSAMLLAYAKVLRQAAVAARQGSAECREMAQQTVMAAAIALVRTDAARKRQDAG